MIRPKDPRLFAIENWLTRSDIEVATEADREKFCRYILGAIDEAAAE